MHAWLMIRTTNWIWTTATSDGGGLYVWCGEYIIKWKLGLDRFLTFKDENGIYLLVSRIDMYGQYWIVPVVGATFMTLYQLYLIMERESSMTPRPIWLARNSTLAWWCAASSL